MVGLLGGGGYFYTRKPVTSNSPFEQAADAMDNITEQNMSGESKTLPSIEAGGAKQWEENGVHWAQDANGQLSYYDATTGAWVPYQG